MNGNLPLILCMHKRSRTYKEELKNQTIATPPLKVGYNFIWHLRFLHFTIFICSMTFDTFTWHRSIWFLKCNFKLAENRFARVLLYPAGIRNGRVMLIQHKTGTHQYTIFVDMKDYTKTPREHGSGLKLKDSAGSIQRWDKYYTPNENAWSHYSSL